MPVVLFVECDQRREGIAWIDRIPVGWSLNLAQRNLICSRGVRQRRTRFSQGEFGGQISSRGWGRENAGKQGQGKQRSEPGMGEPRVATFYQERVSTHGLSRQSGFFRLIAVTILHVTEAFPILSTSGRNVESAKR